ncbi:hypothetical protein P691DRAFT_663498 [Macrolepiota fuliginosa MF-IS2]|uniref:Tetraspanin n=1 Tax=Macrolepiota fuliginosa MF-IS2 TaxID=1400762 RepID=A0A9P5XKM6_9AGAR|nr:hypothetical protein P691DRAFT_663498 [Macrolepiota fuliginosa MF-IS2]
MATTYTRKSRTFCCCIPVRAGVITLAIIGLIGGAGLTALGGIALTQTNANRITSGIQIAVYVILAVVSLLGLVGAIGKKRGLINLYFAILIGHLLFSFALGVYAMYRTFKDSPEYMHQCRGDSEDASVIKVCHEGDMLMKGIVVSISLIAWLLEICESMHTSNRPFQGACVIVFSYSKQLSEEEETRSVVKDNEAW